MWAFWRKRKPEQRRAASQARGETSKGGKPVRSAQDRPPTQEEQVSQEVEQVRQQMRTSPEAAAQVIRKWLREDIERILH